MTPIDFKARGAAYAANAIKMSPDRPGALMTRVFATSHMFAVLEDAVQYESPNDRHDALCGFWGGILGEDIVPAPPSKNETYLENRLVEIANGMEIGNRMEMKPYPARAAMLRSAANQLGELRRGCAEKDSELHEMRIAKDTADHEKRGRISRIEWLENELALVKTRNTNLVERVVKLKEEESRLIAAVDAAHEETERFSDLCDDRDLFPYREVIAKLKSELEEARTLDKTRVAIIEGLGLQLENMTNNRNELLKTGDSYDDREKVIAELVAENDALKEDARLRREQLAHALGATA